MIKTKTGIDGLRSVHFGLPDLDAATRYYTELWGLQVAARTEDAVYLRATGPDYYCLALHRQDQPCWLGADLSIASRQEADALYATLQAQGLTVSRPGPLTEPGGGYGFAFQDPDEGRVFRVVTEQARHADVADVADRPRKLSHLVLNSPDREARFFVDVLGFRLIDQSRTISFLNCNSDHHSLALFKTTGERSFNHLAFEMKDLNSVMSATGNMKEKGEELGWGVGRHGPCDNVFAYFVGPGGFTVEYTAEVEQVDDSYPFRGPEEWGFRPGRRDQWGIATQSERMGSPETKVPFSDALFPR